MTYSVSLSGHVADAATEEAIISELQQFIIDLVEGFDNSPDVILNATFSGMHLGYRNLFSQGTVSVDDLQKVIDDKAREMNAENSHMSISDGSNTSSNNTGDSQTGNMNTGDSGISE